MTYLEKVREMYPEWNEAKIMDVLNDECPSQYFDIPEEDLECPSEVWDENNRCHDCDMCWNREIPCSCSNCTCNTTTENNELKGDKTMRKIIISEERMALATESNPLGLQAYDLVKTAGKGIGIVLRKPSLNNELVVYSMSSVTTTHPHDDDGMAKVRRYNADGTIATHSETTGNPLKNRDKYAIEGIVGIKSYTNPIIAMKDFINQNEDLEFDPVYVEVEEEVAEEPVAEAAANTPVNEGGVMEQMLALLMKINDKLDRI